MIKSQRALLYFLIFAVIFLFGLVANFRVVSLPLIREAFDASWQQQGLLVSLRIIGFVCFCVITGILTSRFGIKRPLLFGFAVICAALAAMPLANSFSATLFLMAAVGCALGVFEVSCNSLASRLFVKNTALMLNILHAFFGLGAIFSPVAASFITNNAGGGWQMVYLSALPLALLLLLLAVFAKFPDSAGPQGGATSGASSGAKKMSFAGALKEPLMWIFAACLGLCISMENNGSNWATMYFLDIYGIDPLTRGAAFMALFFASFTFSRLACGIFIERLGYMKALRVFAAGALCVFAAVILLGARGIFLMPLLGFFVGPLFPTVMAVAFKRFGQDAPVMCSAAIAAGGSLNAAVQYAIGLTNRFFGAAWGFRSSIVYIALFAVMLAVLNKKLKSSAAV